MGMSGRLHRVAFLASILLLSIVGSAAVTTTADPIVNHPYSDVLTNPYLLSNSETIAYSNNGSLIAVSYRESIAIIDATTREFTREIPAGGTVMSLAFSSDDSVLLVGLESPYLNTLAVELFYTDSWQRFGLNDNGTNVNDISVLSGESIFASVNQREGVNEYHFNDSTNHFAAYNGRHSGTIDCIDHSFGGNHLISGGSDGQLLMWNRSTRTVEKEWMNEFPVIDCAFSPTDDMVAWMSESLLQVRSYPEGDYLTSLAISGDVLQMEWSSSGAEIFLLVDSSSPELLVIDSVSFTIANRIKVGHRIAKFSWSPTDSEIALTSLTGHVTLLRKEIWAPFAGEEGVDNDEDGTPDIYDSDDDGDGIADNFEYTCNGGIDCSKSANPETTRKITFTISDNNVRVVDRYLLNATQSASLRKLAAASITSDGVVNLGEALMMEEMLCAGITNLEMIAHWENALKVNNSALISTSIECDAKTGLMSTSHTDTKTKIQIRWFIEMEFANDVERPFSINFDPSVSIPVHTAAQSAPHSPFTIEMLHNGETVYYQSPIFPSSPLMNIFIDVPPPPPPNFGDRLVAWLKIYYWIPLTIITIISMLSIFMTRQKNKITLDFEEEEEETVSRRRQTKRRQPARPPTTTSTSGRPQPAHHPGEPMKKRQPARRPPDQRAIRKVRRVPGATTQSGEAPEGEEWEYSEHGAYWDTDDPDKIDPYGQAKDFHEEEVEIQKIVAQVAAETVTVSSEASESATDEDAVDDESESAELPKGDDMLAALSKITGGAVQQPEVEPVAASEPENATDSPHDQPVKKNRRKVKRRKK